MEKYIIGLDLGINNVGWSIINEETKTIEKCGVRLYNPSDAAADRRNARGSKRRAKRKENRIEDTLQLLEKSNFPSKITIEPNLLEKRVKGLTTQIDKQDITNILCYFMSHRGYIPFGDEERELIILNGLFPCEYYLELKNQVGKYRALEKVVNNTDLEKELIQILITQSQFYPELKEIKESILVCFKRKRKFWEGPGNEKSLTDYGRFKTQEDVLEYQALKNSGKEKYLYEELIGKCKIKIDEKCAPKGNFYAEQFNLINDFINISINNSENIISQEDISLNEISKVYKFTTIGIEKIINYCLTNSTPSLTYVKLLKDVFGLSKHDISGFRINKAGKPEFSTMNTFRYIKKEFKKNKFSTEWIENPTEYNQVISYLTVAPGMVEIEKMIHSDELIKHAFTEQEIKLLKTICDKLKSDGILSYHSLSETILKKAIKDMLSTNLNFMQVRNKFHYDEEAKKYFIDNYQTNPDVPVMSSQYVDDIISSPQVKKTLRQAILIINAIIKEKGDYPNIISVESTKEINSKDQISSINKMQKINETNRKSAMNILKTHFSMDKVTEKNIQKIMLFEEINGICPYCGKNMDKLDNIVNANLEREHILPLSQSFDDSFDNLTLSCRTCNESKKNQTPFAWLKETDFEEFTKRINQLKISDKKRQNFLTTDDLDKFKIRFFNRNLRDTAYATKELIKQIHIFNDYLNSKIENTEIKTLSTPGQLTNKIRKEYESEKDREAGKFHHAVDASIVASIALTDIGKIIIDSQNNRQFWVEKRKDAFNAFDKIEKFNIEIIKKQLDKIDSDEKIQLSTQIIKDPNRNFSNASVYKIIKKDEKTYKIEQITNIYKKDLMKDKTKLDILFDETNLKLTLLCQDSDKKLFAYLKDIYFKYQSDLENPFLNYCFEVNMQEEKTFDEKKHGIKTPNKKNLGVLVKNLRYYSPISDPFFLNKKNIEKKENTYIALDSISQYCTRLFWDIEENKFLFLPVFCPSVNLKTNKIKTNVKNYKYFYNKFILGKNVKYITDLFNGNYVEITKSNGDRIEGIIKGYSKSNNAIELKHGLFFHEKDPNNFDSGGKYLSSKDIVSIFDVDVLGNRKYRLTWPII